MKLRELCVAGLCASHPPPDHYVHCGQPLFGNTVPPLQRFVEFIVRFANRSGDALWEDANSINAKRFAQQLQKTRDMVQKRSLLIEDEHYENLKRLMQEFGDFDLGKTRLLELRRAHFPLENVPDHDVQRVIQQNQLKKEAYSHLLTELERSLKNQLRNPTRY